MLHVHRAERADGLVAALGDLLASPPADPMAAEVVAVPTRGVERWLAQSLSERLGVCANVDFPSPDRVVAGAVALACGVDPETDPWRPERLTWALLDVVEEHLEAPWLSDLRRHLGEPDDHVRRARRLGAVRDLAERFDRYALFRPDLLEQWRAGEPEHWQGQLWKRLRTRLATADPAERVVQAGAAIVADPALLSLPPRLALFGLTRLPPGHLRVLEAIASGRDVHLFLLHPSPALWAKLEAVPPAAVRRDDGSALLARNPLLRSWGREVRELQQIVGGPSEHHPTLSEATTQLARLQRSVRDDEPPPADPADGSIQVHACHGRARQVEVLRDAILHTLEGDDTLEPRDVIVMCPDVETFAPLIQATFGGREDLRVRIADRSLRQTNGVLGVVATLLDLAGARMTASEVLDFADREPVRRRFRLRDDDLARLQTWIAASGIRWGLDAEHRAPWKVGDTRAGTFSAGLDRILAGVAQNEDEARLIHGVLPLDDVDSMSIDLAGSFAELVDRLETTIDAFHRPQPASEWVETLAAAADAFTALTARDAWQRAELQGILADLAEHGAGVAHDLDLQEVRSLLTDRLAGRPTRANFRTGNLTVCTLYPMRSVPHRVVCLLGLDDGVFPRGAPRDGDDLSLVEPRVGDRDPRSEDRQMLLDALMAASDRLIVTYTGNDERTNAPRPPAVPVGELLDVCGDDVLIRHPLQPFHADNFVTGALVAGTPWSFDAPALAGAVELRDDRERPGVFLPAPLDALEEEVIELENLVRFVSHPVRRFLRGRLGIELRDFTKEVEDRLDIEFDGLQDWKVGDQLLELRLDGVDNNGAREALLRGGRLPPGALGAPVVERTLARVEKLIGAAGADRASTLDVEVELPDGRRILGTVPGLCERTLRTVTYSSLAAKPRVVAWVRLLALSAFAPDAGYHALTVMRDRNGIARRTLPALSQADALAHLAELVELYERGLRAPLALACKTSAAYVELGPRMAAAEWTSGYTKWGWRDREDVEREHVLAYGSALTFDALAARPGFHEDAHLLWDPLLAREGR